MDDQSPRILISRLSHIGDCIETLPVASALRAHFPRAMIAWAVEPPTDQLLRGHAAIDELLVVPRGWLKSPAKILRLRRQLRSLRIEVAIDPQSLTKSALVSWLSGAPLRIGLAPKLGREFAPILNNHRVATTKPHVVDRSLQLLGPLGIFEPAVEFALPRCVSAKQKVANFVTHSHLGCGFAVINPGAGWKSRLWAASRFGAVAKHLAHRHRLATVVTWAGPDERRWADQITAHSGGNALVAPKTSLVELAALLEASRLFVGCDTGPMHMAVAVGTDCVVLHGTTLPEISGPYGPGHETVQAYYQQGTSRQRRSAANDAMLAITVEQVWAACDRLLKRQADGLLPANAA